MIHHQIQQNSEEWEQLRVGKVTGSVLGTIMANDGKAFGDPAKALAVNIALEQITGNRISSGYSNAHMERGHEQEPIARMLYQDEMFCDVLNGGFFDCGKLGCSPDGCVNDDGLIEIKSVISTTHFKTVSRQSFDPSYKWQLIGNMKIAQKEWIDFISYCADFPVGKQLFIHRLHADHCKAEYANIDARLDMFFEYVDSVKSAIINNTYSVLE